MVKVSLIIPSYNEESSLSAWKDSFMNQTAYPDELIFVDGGSTDATVSLLKNFQDIAEFVVKIIVNPKFNRKSHSGPIAAARNLAIEEASYDLIVCTDLGCVLSHDWFEGMKRALLKSRAVKGRYIVRSNDGSEFDFGKSFTPSSNKYLSSAFLPSSRSVGFHKDLWRCVGGYPEDSYTAEDTVFAMRISESFDFTPVEFGHVEWVLPDDKALAIKIQNYAKGDKEQGLFSTKYVIKLIFWRLLIGRRRFIWQNESLGYWGR
jgi:glycosyltransferase involved in cell wall biosynthesis